MQIVVDNPFELSLELGAGREGAVELLHREPIAADLPDLVEETFVSGVLAERLPAQAERLAVRIAPRWVERPVVRDLVVRVETHAGGEQRSFSRRFARGRWTRRAQAVAGALRAEGRVAAELQVYSQLLAAPALAPRQEPWPTLAAPEISDGSLEELGLRPLGHDEPGGGELDPDRPLLASAAMVEEILDQTERAGLHETGGALLGRIVRLAQPLPGTRTRVVTLLCAALPDPRHVGAPGSLQFSPEALMDAARIAELRGRREQVLTVYHSHGFGTPACRSCNRSENCPLPPCTLVSEDDYQVLESLFPSKCSVMPISGRKPGALGSRPVLEIHVWRGGHMQPLAWRRYEP